MDTRYRRIAASGISLCILAAFLTGEGFILLYADHDHTGETCPVCAQMEVVSDAVRRLSDGPLRPAALLCQSLLPLSVSMFLSKFSGNTRNRTLITTKVRLND
jgi:hypothetical protein